MLPQRRHNFEILLLWASSAISAPWRRHQSTMADIIESTLRIQIPNALFSEIGTTTETCWIESISLGYNARFFATHRKIDQYIKFNNEVEKHIPDLGTKIWWTLHFEREIYFCTRQGGLPTAFDLAAFRLSMIAPVKKSVNHSGTLASMRETG